MDDSDDEVAAYQVENEEQFWEELAKIVASPCDTHEAIDDTLRSFLGFTITFKQEYLVSEYDVVRCCYQLLDSPVFHENQDYVRRQILYGLLQEDDADTLHLAAAVLLFDGRVNEACFEMMSLESAFPRLVELVRTKDGDPGLHRLLLQLLFEMSRIQKLSREDLQVVDDAFILYLFQLIEELSDDADDPYHYPIIRVLLVLNEQYMCLANATSPTEGNTPVTNRILKLLSKHGPQYRTFGENLILLLNRESELGPQLVILKLLYLLFTTPPTYEYFYTNDLHVLVDVIIRNLLDLDPGNGAQDVAPDGSELAGQKALRHTYLRVLCPLLKNTQLAHEGNHYKREEVRKLLYLLVNRSSAHFAPVDGTVIRLVIRCKEVEWLREEGDELEQELKDVAPVAKKMLGLGMSVEEGTVSSLSVAGTDVVAKTVVGLGGESRRSKPSLPAPRRGRKSSARDVAVGNGGAGDGLKQEGLKPPATTVGITTSGESSPVDMPSPFADENAET